MVIEGEAETGRPDKPYKLLTGVPSAKRMEISKEEGGERIEALIKCQREGEGREAEERIGVVPKKREREPEGRSWRWKES